jgi:hypothetical protein
MSLGRMRANDDGNAELQRSLNSDRAREHVDHRVRDDARVHREEIAICATSPTRSKSTKTTSRRLAARFHRS